MNYIKSPLLLILLSFANIAYADIPKPTKCPDINEIRRIGVNTIDEGFPIIGYIVSHTPAMTYGTEQPWEFKMYIDRIFRSTAWSDAKKGLNNLRYVSGPTLENWSNTYNLWTCKYETKYAKHVVAEYFEKKTQ